MARSAHTKITIAACCFIFIGISSYSQNLKEHLSDGDKFYQKKDYTNALKSYLKAVELDDKDADTHFKIGISYLNSEKKTKSAPSLEKAYSLKPDVDPDINYHLGMAYQNNHQYAEAGKHYQVFKEKNKNLAKVINQKIKACHIGDSILRHPAQVEIKPFGPGVNSSFSDTSPLLTKDGQTMIYTSNRSIDIYKIKSSTNLENILIVHKENGQWGTPLLISDNINTKFNDAATGLSQDGKTLLLFYEEGQGDIYTSTFENEAWTKPVALNGFINNPHYRENAASISPDGKKLFFSSNRPGGRGNFDLYVSELDSKGRWGRPSNLGSTINTNGNEDSPFIHANGKTLYFSSDGQPTLGSSDIFKSELKDGKWTRPENLGYPINSNEYEGFFSLSPDQRTGYYSAFRENGLGNMDLYIVNFQGTGKEAESVLETKRKTGNQTENSPPKGDFIDPVIQLHEDKNIVTKLRGKIIDVRNATPLSATISLVDNSINRIISKITSTESGDFELVIPHGGNYGVTTEKNGYLFNSINFNVPAFESYQEVDTHILMVKAEAGSKVVLKNIFFDMGKSDLKTESLPELENVRDLLLLNKKLHVQINGYTDNKGDPAHNRLLSLKRSESVVDYLIKNGIEPNRLKAKGYGSERPLVSNDDEEEGRQLNRRTEIEIINPPMNR